MASGPSEVTAEHLADLKSVREAQLVRKFAAGRPLLELEMCEIAHLIPAAALADPPPLQVEYLREIPEYAAEIGVHKRSVYRWVDMGVQARDPVPLDQPGQILAWWARHMSRSAPEYLVKWAANAKPTGQGATAGAAMEGSGSTASAKTGGASSKESAGPQRMALDLGGMTGMGIEASVQLLRQTVEANSKLVAAAMANPDDSALAHYQSRFEKSMEQLRKAEEALFKFQKMRGDLAPKSEFRADLVNLLTGLRGMMRRRANNVTAAARVSLEELKIDPAVVAHVLGVVRAAVESEGKRDEQLLRSARFWQTLPSGEIVTEPPPAAPPTPPTPTPDPALATAAT